MVNPKELRLGNYVVYHGLNVFYKGYDYIEIDEIREDGINSVGEYHVSIKPEEIEPIPLTEKWLIDFGFKKSESDEFEEWSTDKSFILKDKKGQYYYPYGSAINIQYVHQLQNLHFGLTGIELTNS